MRCAVNPPFSLVACLVVFCFCFAPLSIYFFYLAALARRHQPTVVSGPWDFARLTAGLSGFFLFGGGLFLSLLQSNFRFWMRGNLEAFRGAWGSEKTTWIFLSLLYIFTIIATIAVALYSRRRSLVIYNIDHTEFEASIPEVFERLTRPIERRGKVWIGAVPYFELDSNDGGRTVTIRWLSDDLALFGEIERLIREAVRTLAPEENPAAPWLMAIAGGLAVWAAGSFGFLLVYFFSLK